MYFTSIFADDTVGALEQEFDGTRYKAAEIQGGKRIRCSRVSLLRGFRNTLLEN